ncbi:MAG: hypothetical protein KAW56_00545, partial [Candidatus Marinimicrobia bacterium]|nr:hypothetical protein [Candidatus Neomarinimicrobiota bacterium]
VLTISFAYPLRYDAMIKIYGYNIDINEYFTVYGLYHFKKYLDSLDEPKSKKFEFIVSRDKFNKETIKPFLSGGFLVDPINQNLQEKIKKEEKLRDRVLKFLYTRKDFQRDPKYKLESKEMLESIFCDKRELNAAEKYLLDEDFINPIRWITPKGVKKVEENVKEKTPNTWYKKAFVAQSFNPDVLPVFDKLFYRVISDSGFEPKIISAQEPERGIDAEILNTIDNSAFLISDLTLERPSVYLEAGYALGKGIKVFFTAREDHNTDNPSWRPGKPKTHFDIRNYKITWWNTDDYKPAYDELIERIKSWLGKRK